MPRENVTPQPLKHRVSDGAPDHPDVHLPSVDVGWSRDLGSVQVGIETPIEEVDGQPRGQQSLLDVLYSEPHTLEAIGRAAAEWAARRATGTLGEVPNDNTLRTTYAATPPNPATVKRGDLWIEYGGHAFHSVDVVSTVPVNVSPNDGDDNPTVRQALCDGATDSQWRVIPGAEVTFADTGREVLDLIKGSSVAAGFTGYYTHLDRGDVNRLIALLRKARNSACGRDE